MITRPHQPPKRFHIYSINFTSKSFTLSKLHALCAQKVLAHRCRIYWKVNKQQLQNDLSSVFQGSTLLSGLWALSNTHSNGVPHPQMQLVWIHSIQAAINCLDSHGNNGLTTNVHAELVHFHKCKSLGLIALNALRWAHVQKKKKNTKTSAKSDVIDATRGKVLTCKS